MIDENCIFVCYIFRQRISVPAVAVLAVELGVEQEERKEGKNIKLRSNLVWVVLVIIYLVVILDLLLNSREER